MMDRAGIQTLATQLNSTHKSIRCHEVLKLMLIYTATQAINSWCYKNRLRGVCRRERGLL